MEQDPYRLGHDSNHTYDYGKLCKGDEIQDIASRKTDLTAWFSTSQTTANDSHRNEVAKRSWRLYHQERSVSGALPP
jgi:hypothetical protein